MFPRLPARTTFVVADTKTVSDFVQKHFVSATNVSQFVRARKHHEQQCFRNNVFSFATAFKVSTNYSASLQFIYTGMPTVFK